MIQFKFLTYAIVTFLGLSALASSVQASSIAMSVPRDSHHITSLKVSAADSSDEIVKGASAFIESVTARGLDFLQSETLSEEARTKDFRKLLDDSFDLKTIGRFALGRYWRDATDAQRKEYMPLFENMVVETYARKFKEYQGQKIELKDARAEGASDAIVRSVIIPKDAGPNVSVDWRVRQKNGNYKVIDVLVEGVSMSLNQRSEFASIIQRGGGNVDALIAKLKSN